MKTPTKTVWIGDTGFDVEYDYIRAEAPIYDLDSPVCGPGHDAYVELVSVKCNDSEHELIDLLDAKVLDLISEQILVEYSE